ATMLGGGAIAYVMLAVSASQIPFLLLPGIALAYAAGWGWNGLFNFAVASRYPDQAARATGITAVGGRTGGVIGPFIFGIIVTHSSYGAAWLLAAAAAITGAGIILYSHRHQ